ncbi:sulfite exporter TauE/SafE family protein [Lapidilactobacillus wuchangensis]|uniref:sulfite exporter TauE/SafE family protein n=1 Tax=Lapidilactobacillus wuchangensis TaxID=2486001 RepID=UPI001CDC6DCC|nr:sulfite exporter TauE/SafE family protein [Lapidilactobacillus wuchangensis]
MIILQTLWQLWLVLIPTGIAAGIVSSATGLASLVSYPILLAIGLPPVVANVTNTYSLFFAELGATISSKKELHGHQHDLKVILPLTLIGCVIGSLILFMIPASTFEKVVPFFILLAALVVLWPQNYRRKPTIPVGQPATRQQNLIKIATWAGIFLVGVYSGYFGAASGVLMLSLLAVISPLTFAEYNAEKNVTLGLANLISAIIYATQTTIQWHYIIPLAIGFLVGGFIGPVLVRRIPERVIKVVIGIGSLILAATLFIQAYRK